MLFGNTPEHTEGEPRYSESVCGNTYGVPVRTLLSALLIPPSPSPLGIGVRNGKMTAPAAVRSTQENDATYCGLWPETRFGPQPHREPRAVQSPRAGRVGKANTVTVDLFTQHWDSAHNMSRGMALNNEDAGHGPYRRINPTARKQRLNNPA